MRGGAEKSNSGVSEMLKEKYRQLGPVTFHEVCTLGLFSLLVIIRAVRIFRFVRLVRIYFEHRRLVKGVRQRISENKRRFQVSASGFDITFAFIKI